ncbi:MAG: tetratricopeptide repeat protein, partial [Rhodothermales bacterium]|nr:tetratricopeptide repeat protein [Rhodothermales bacterium]
VQGGSTAAGFPFYYGGSFADMLEQRLLQSAPERPVEVINTAMAAVNSYTLLDFVDEIIEQEPDIVVIYAGHNEYYGALGVGSTFSLGSSPTLIRLFLSLDHFKTVQALKALLSRIASIGKPAVEEGSGGTLMSQVVGEQSIPLGSRLYQAGLDQFRGNLRRILKRYQKAGVPVYIGTVASNLRDHRPFVSQLAEATDTEQFREAVRALATAEQRGDSVSVLLELVDRLIAIDSLAADPYYTKGQLLLRAGRDPEALDAFIAARDRDQLRFRAPQEINDIIRAEADAFDAVVVETERRLATTAVRGIVGSDLMTEHLHPNVEGYFQLASAFYEQLASDSAVAGWQQTITDDAARSELLVTEIDSRVGEYRIKQLTGSWPFQPAGTLSRYTLPERSEDPIEQISLDLFRRKVPRNVALDALRSEYLKQNNFHDALRATLAVVQRYPFLSSPYVSAASIMVEQRRLDEALLYVDAALDRDSSAEALSLKGSVLLAKGLRAQAIPVLESALQLNPESIPTGYNLAGAYALSGRIADARALVEDILRRDPGNADARRLAESLGR